MAARRARAALAVLCGLGAVASAVLCARLYDPDAFSRAYYGTDTRAQALLIGAALAAVLARAGGRLATRSHRLRGLLLACLAVLGTTATAWLWHRASDDARWLYTGGFGAAAAATAAVIAHVVVSPRAPLARLLALSPLVWLGRISYGVYLWHWPLFSFVTADATGLSRWPLLAVRLLGTLAAATLSYHLIEQPIRHGALSRHLPRRLPAAVTAAALGLAIVTIGWATAIPPQPPRPPRRSS